MAKRKRVARPIVSNVRGLRRTDRGIYSDEIWVLKSDTGDDVADVQEVLASRLKAPTIPRNLLDQVKWLRDRLVEAGLNDDPEVTAIAAEGFVQTAKLLESGPTEREAEIFLAGVHVGRRLERLEVLPHQWAALNGKRQASRNSKTAKGRSVPDKELESRVQAVQDKLAAQSRAGKRLSREKAYEVVAAARGLSKRTIKQSYLEWQSRSAEST